MTAPNAAQVTTTTTLTTTSETVAIVTPPRAVNTPGGQTTPQGQVINQGILIQGLVSGAVGAGTTSIQVRVRQGANGGVGATNPAGVQVGATVQVSVTAAGFHSIPVSVLDASAFALINGSAQYAITVQQVAATGNGSVTLAQIAEESCNVLGE